MARIRHRASPSRSTLAFFPFPSAATTRATAWAATPAPAPRGAVPARSLTPRRNAGSPRNAPASLWSRRHWAARRSAVRRSSVIVCRILWRSRASRIRLAIQRTTPLRRGTSRPVTAPASPVIRSPRTSILSDLLKPSVQGIIFTFA